MICTAALCSSSVASGLQARYAAYQRQVFQMEHLKHCKVANYLLGGEPALVGVLDRLLHVGHAAGNGFQRRVGFLRGVQLRLRQ